MEGSPALTMMNQRYKYSAWSLVGLTFLLMVAAFTLIWLNRSVELPGGYNSGSMVVWTVGFVIVPIIGGLIAARQPHNPYGWIWLTFGLAFSLLNFCEAYAIHGLIVDPGSLPLANVALILGGLGWFIGIFMLPFLLLLFPTGHLPSSRWRFLVWVLIVALLIGVAAGWASPGQSGIAPVENPYGLEGSPGQVAILISEMAVFIDFGVVFLGALSLAFRYRGATGVVRQQLKWFAFGAIFFTVFLISDFFIEFPGIWESLKETISFSVLPVAVGIAILRYRLYDIDLIIHKTLVYGLLSAVLALVYFGSVVLLQDLFTRVTGQKSPAAIVLSTLLIASLFQPLRRRVKEVIDRRFYRRKYDAAITLAAFAQRARDEVDLEKLTAALLDTVQDTMQPVQISLWLKQRGDPLTAGIPRDNYFRPKAEGEPASWPISQ